MEPKTLIDLKNLRPNVRVDKGKNIKSLLWLGVSMPLIISLGILSLFLLYLTIKSVWKLVGVINGFF